MTSRTPGGAIGGYFEFPLGPTGSELYTHALHLQSARACLHALLRAGRPRRLWMPWYLCETLVAQVRLAGVEVARYALEQDFAVQGGLELDAGDWLLYVNYFGLCDDQVDMLIRRFPAAQVVIDSSHALYSPPRDCLGTIYSPRKFAGLPDGGLLVSRLAVPEPEDQDAASAWRCAPLLIRADQGPESGYAEYLKAEDSLAGQEPLRMSNLTRGLLQRLDYPAIAARRRANFALLDGELGKVNPTPLGMGAGAVPLVYPYLRGSAGLRKFLVGRRVYVQHFWPNLLSLAGVPAFERFLAEICIPLPCDQRYGEIEMREIVSLIREYGG